MSFLPERIIERYYLLLRPPLGRPEGGDEKPNEEQKKKIEKWLLKNFMSFPHIPDLFFENFKNQKKSRKTPLDIFTSIEYQLLRLQKFKLLITQNLDGLKNQFNTIVINKSKYGIDPSSKDNAIPSFMLTSNAETILNDLFYKTTGKYSYFPNFFIHGYFKNNNSLVKYNESSPKIPLFAKFFMDNYNGEVKDFIVKLFKEYIQIRTGLIKNIQKYYGILAFKSIFDFKSEDLLKIEQKKKMTPNSFNKNFEAKSIYNEVSLNVTENSNYNSSYNAYLKSVGSTNVQQKKNKLSNEQKLKLQEAYNFMQLKQSNDIYKNLGNENILEFSHKENIKNIFSKICENLKNLYQIQFLDLYQFMLLSIELDYLTLQFIFNFVRPDLFLNALKVKKEIYKFINKNIDLYYEYIEDFDIWIYNYLLNYQIDPFRTGDQKFEDVYQTFYNFILNMFEKTKDQRLNNFINELNNEGVFVDIENSYSKTFFGEEESKEYEKLMNEAGQSNAN